MQEKSLRVLEFYKIREMLVEKAASQMGKERCASLVPESDFAAVQSLQAETEEASAIVARTGIQPISPFDDISAPVGRARVGSILSPKELLQCARLMQAARSVRRMLVNEKEEESETPHITNLARALLPMRDLEDEIFGAILSEDEIADSASPALASVRRKIRSANERIRDRLNGYLHSETMAKYLQDTLITMRQGRYVLPVRAEYRSQVPGIVHDQSSSGATLFIEPMAIVEINNDLRSLMGNVNQEAILFNDTFFNNISFGVEGATLEQVQEAARIANAHDFIMASEDGYDTNIGDRGGKLSGGQRQRISIARAILKNPPILILDEATSALDTESERLVQEALENLMRNRTTIVIAHRLSTIRNADEICVMHEGEIVERGRHEELIGLDGYYKRLCDMQSF